jgi:hypothetical protein
MPVKFAARRWIALPLVLLGTLIPASAHAALNMTATAAPANPQAGAHSDFVLSINVGGTDDIKDLTTQLPPGLVGNPQSGGPNGFCSPVALNGGTCPPESVIGSASSTIQLISGLPLTVNASGSVYNMIPQGNDPATLGIRLTSPGNLTQPVILIGHASARSTDFGLNTTINNIPNSASTPLGSVPIHITQTGLTLNSSFMTNPTSCGLKTTHILADSYQSPNTTEEATPAPTWNSTGCQNQAYHPNLGVTIDMSKDKAHILNPDLTTDVTQGINEANSRRVEAILPSTVQANNAALNHQCDPTLFPLDPTLPQSCPANTQVGTAVAQTPLLSQPLQGPVYLIKNAGLLPRVGLDLKGPLPARIIGNATPTADLRLDNVFGGLTPAETIGPGLPDVPLSSFRLTFGGGPGGLIVATDAVCSGPSQYNAVFDSFGGQHVTQQSNAKVIGCGFKKRLLKGRCDHKKLTDVGTKHRDTIRGTKKRDVINGLGGNDKIVGLKGNDLLCGGKGKDKISGGPGKDQLFGGPGKDKLIGGGGLDKLAGGPGKDKQKQ